MRRIAIFLALTALIVSGAASAAPVHLSYVGGDAMLARAGGTWSILMVVTRSDTGKAVGPEGRITCHASSGTTRLPLVSREFTIGGAPGAVCTFQVPLRFRSRLLRSTLTISYAGQFVTHVFTTRAH